MKKTFLFAIVFLILFVGCVDLTGVGNQDAEKLVEVEKVDEVEVENEAGDRDEGELMEVDDQNLPEDIEKTSEEKVPELSDFKDWGLLGHNYYRDENYVYYTNPEYNRFDTLILSNVDSETVEVINEACIKDAERVYCDMLRVYFHLDEYEMKVLPEADSATFQVFDDPDYARDENYVYINAYDGGSSRTENFEIAAGVDADTFELLEYGYFKDENRVYHNGFRGYTLEKNLKILKEVDAGTVEIVSPHCLKDANQVYCDVPYNKEEVEIEMETVKGADPASFKGYYYENYFSDKDQVFCNEYEKGIKIVVLEEADVATFKVIDRTWAEDAEYEFEGCEAVKKKVEVEPLSFSEVGADEIRDLLNWNYLEINENEDWMVVIRYSNLEAQRETFPMLLKNKKTGQFYVANRSVWDADFDEEGNIVAGVMFFDVNKKNVDSLADLLRVDEEKIMASAKNYHDMSGVDSVNALVRITLPEMKVEYLSYLGGEEVSVEGDKVVFTNYGESTDFSIYQKWSNYMDYCERAGEENCDPQGLWEGLDNIEVKIREVSLADLSEIKSYQLEKFGEIKAQKEYEYFDIYSNLDEDQRQEQLEEAMALFGAF